jgi:formylglycine-generating enzyme required for sulfatase activity
LAGCSAEAQKVLKDCDTCPDLVSIPPGDLWVDALQVAEIPPGQELPVKDFRSVEIQGFLMGRTEVTRGQWRALMGSPGKNPAGYGDDYPMTNVSWKEAQEYVRRLNQKTGHHYRLPTEAEWVYAARAGTPDGHHFAYDVSQISLLAWHTGNREFSRVIDCPGPFHCGMINAPRLSQVAKKDPNGFGLYDIYGNAEEWVEDAYHRYVIQWPDETPDLREPADPTVRILRGGSVLQDPLVLINQRSGYQRDTRSPFGGFRVARSLPFTPRLASVETQSSQQP